MSTAMVRVFGDGTGSEYGRDHPVVAFVTDGGMHRADNSPALGACFYVTPIDYAGLTPFVRSKYAHLLILCEFDWTKRRGEYIHIPYGGRIVIEAI